MRYMGRTEADIHSVRSDGGRGRLIVNTADELVSQERPPQRPGNALRVPLQL
jgi:hypothetical protein